ncbi:MULTISPECIES: PPA1309 family protein [unclassified Gordonia (in: high G+C Gram-positive bacteria)]
MSQPHRFSPDDLGRTLRDALGFLTPHRWGQSPTVFALVPTEVLAALHPEVVDADDDSVLSPIAEEPLETADQDDPFAALEEFLSTASWQEPVVGAAVVVDITVLPPDARDELAHDHPDARRARLAVGALRGGPTLALLELEPDDADQVRELRTHPDLATDLRAALAAALED